MKCPLKAGMLKLGSMPSDTILGGGRNLRIWDFVERSETLAYLWSFPLVSSLFLALCFLSTRASLSCTCTDMTFCSSAWGQTTKDWTLWDGAKWIAPLLKYSLRYFGHRHTKAANRVTILLTLWWLWRTADGEQRLSVSDITEEPSLEAALAPRETVRGLPIL